MQSSTLIWIVDDDIDDQYLLTIALEQVLSPLRIESLADGDELLPRLLQASTLPDLILLDLNMTRQDGFQTLAELRGTPAYGHLPVIILTTSSAPTDREKSLNLGANGYLVKPARQEEMVRLARQLVIDWQLQ